MNGWRSAGPNGRKSITTGCGGAGVAEHRPGHLSERAPTSEPRESGCFRPSASSGMLLWATDRCRLPKHPNRVCSVLSGGAPDLEVEFAPIPPTGDVDSVTRRWFPRLRGAVLVAVMLSGGGALPVLDALLYHRRAHLGRPHFETAGVPHSHGDVCRLGSSAPYSPRAPLLNVGLPIADACYQAEATLPATGPRSSNLVLLPRPRAPPGLRTIA